MNYRRYFITLLPDSKGFEFNGKEPLGSCVLEERGKSGKLSLWVQDLKAETSYKIVIILYEMGKFTGISLGSLYVDGKGKGDFKSELDSSGFLDGQDLSRMCAVAVIVGGNELISPLVGYKDGPVIWKNHFTIPNDENKIHVKKIRIDMASPPEEKKPNFTESASLQEVAADKQAEYTTVNTHMQELAETYIKERMDDGLLEMTGADTKKPADVDMYECVDTEKPETAPADMEKPFVATMERPFNADMEGSFNADMEKTIIADGLEYSYVDAFAGSKNAAGACEDTMPLTPIEANAPQIYSMDTTMPDMDVDLDKIESKTVIEPESSELMDKYDTAEESQFKFYKNESNAVEYCDEKSNVTEEYPKEPEYKTLGGLEAIFDSNIEITPFESKSSGTKWVRVSLREPVYLPIEYRLLMNHPFIIAAYKKYNHFIMGQIINKDKTEYVFGVPGIYEPQYISSAHQMGFTQFKTVVESHELRPNDYGYWLTPLYTLN